MERWELLSRFTNIIPIMLLVSTFGYIFRFIKLDLFKKLIGCYLVFCLLIDVISRSLLLFFDANIMLIPVFAAGEYLIFTYIYFRFVFKSSRIIYAIAPVIVILIISDYWMNNFIKINLEIFQSYSRAIGVLSIIVYTLIYYIRLIRSDIAINKVFMRFNAITLAYFTVMLVAWLPTNFIYNSILDARFYIWTLIILSNVLYYIYLIYVLWGTRKTQLQ